MSESVAKRFLSPGDSLAAAAGLRSGSRDPYVLHEDRGQVGWAEDEVADVELRADGRVSMSTGGRQRAVCNDSRNHPSALSSDHPLWSVSVK